MNNYSKYLSHINPASAVIGIDLARDAVKVFQLEKKGEEQKIRGWGKKSVPQGMMDGYEIRDIPLFAKFIEEAIDGAAGKIKGRLAVVSIPENKIFARVITLPKMDESEAFEAIKWETEANIPISIDEVYFDWQIFSSDDKNMKVLVFACPKKTIENYIQAFEAAGIQIVAFEAESIASGRAIIKESEKDAVLLVDIGSDATSYAIYVQGFPVFTSCGVVTGKLITDTFAKYFNMNNQKAESYKIKIGLGVTQKERVESLQAVGSLVNNMISEIEKTIAFYDESLSAGMGGKIGKVMVCGGSSNMRGLVSYLGQELSRQVCQANPWENVKIGEKLPPLSKEEAQGYVTAIGLALRKKQ